MSGSAETKTQKTALPAKSAAPHQIDRILGLGRLIWRR